MPRTLSRRALLWGTALAALAALLVAWASGCAGSGGEGPSLPPWPGEAGRHPAGDPMTDDPTAPVLRLYGEILEGTISPEVLPRLGELYAEDVRFRDPIKDLRGFEALHDYYADFLELAQGGTFTIDRWIEEGGADGGHAAVTWTMCLAGGGGAGEERQRRCFGGMSHLIHDGARITAQRDYFDMGEAVYDQVGVLRFIHRRVKSRF